MSDQPVNLRDMGFMVIGDYLGPDDICNDLRRVERLCQSGEVLCCNAGTDADWMDARPAIEVLFGEILKDLREIRRAIMPATDSAVTPQS